MRSRRFEAPCAKRAGFFVALLAAFACGTEAADVGEDCPSAGATTGGGTATTNTASSADSASSSTTVASSSAATSSASGSSSSGGGEPAPMFDAPDAAEVASRLHSCRKLSYAQVGAFLRSRGVAVVPGSLADARTTAIDVPGVGSQTLGALFGGSGAACETFATPNSGGNSADPLCGAGSQCFCNQSNKTALSNRSCADIANGDAADGYCVSKPATAAFLYFTSGDAFGVAKPNSRLAEKEEHTTASATRLFDIFVQAAPQIIANIGDPAKAPACTIGGKNLPMFHPGDGACVPESLSCLLGMPASDDHLLLCNLLVAKANPMDAADLARKRAMAIAVLMSGTHACQ